MSKQNFWFLRLGEKGALQYEHAALCYSAISIGFGVKEDLTGMGLDEIKQAHFHGDHQVDKFVNKMSKGDIVLLQFRDAGENRQNYDYRIALVVGDYMPLQKIANHKNLVDPMRPARSVALFNERLRESDFGDTLDYMVKAVRTVIKIKEDDEKGQKLIEQIYKVLTQKN